MPVGPLCRGFTFELSSTTGVMDGPVESPLANGNFFSPAKKMLSGMF